MSDEGSATTNPADQIRELFGQTESQAGTASERLVMSNAFGELLAMATENVVAVVKMGADFGDLVVRNLRLAGRRDITRLARQLGRTEDKLELVLREVERLREQQAAATGGRVDARGDAIGNGGTDGAGRGPRGRSRGSEAKRA
jgi:hypothetical protein